MFGSMHIVAFTVVLVMCGMMFNIFYKSSVKITNPKILCVGFLSITALSMCLPQQHKHKHSYITQQSYNYIHHHTRNNVCLMRRIITYPYISLYVQLHTIMCRYASWRIIACCYVSLRVATCHCVSLPCHNMSIPCHYVLLRHN